MTKYVVYTDIGLAGTDQWEIAEDCETLEQAQKYAYEIAYERANSELDNDDLGIEENAIVEDWNVAVESMINYFAEEYNPEKHDGHL
jgi:hypothetical protein